MTQPLAQGDEVNAGFFDAFTLVHFAAGYLIGSLGVGVVPAAVLGALWECVERPLKDAYPEWFPHATQDTWKNILTDTLAFTAGALLARR